MPPAARAEGVEEAAVDGPVGAAARAAVYTPTILLLAAVVGGSFMGLGFIMPLRALYARDAGASSVEIGLMTSSFLLAGFLVAPGVGWLSDRLGHGRLLWAGLLFHAAIVLAYIPVQAPLWLIALRGLEGVAVAAVLPPARALVNVLAPAERQGEALGLLSAARSAGVLSGPVAGTLLAGQFGYLPSFLIACAALVLGAAVTLCCLPAQGRAASAEGKPLRSRPLGFAGGGALTRPLKLDYGLTLILAIPQGVIMAIWTLYLLDRGVSLPLIGLTFTAFALPSLLVSPLAGRWSDRHGRYAPILAGLALTGLIYTAYSLALPPYVILAVCVLEGIAVTIVRSATDGLLADVTPPGLQGRVQANYTAIQSGGFFLGATLAGFLYQVRPGLPYLIDGLLCLGVAAILLLPRTARLFKVESAAMNARR